MTRERDEVKVLEDTIHTERKRSVNSDDHSPKSALSKRPRLDLDNKEFKARGKRMLGMIFNTLDKFKKDTNEQLEADKRRKEIENKLQERLKKEKKELEEEIKQDDEIRRKKRIEEEKQRLIDLKKYWNQQNILKSNFIKTKSTPHIYYFPAKLNDETKKILEEQKREALKTISLNTDPIEIISSITPTPISATSENDHQMKDSSIPEKDEKEMSLSPVKKFSSEDQEMKEKSNNDNSEDNSNNNNSTINNIIPENNEISTVDPLSKEGPVYTSNAVLQYQINATKFIMSDLYTLVCALEPESVIKEYQDLDVDIELSGKYARGLTCIDWLGNGSRTLNARIILKVDKSVIKNILIQSFKQTPSPFLQKVPTTSVPLIVKLKSKL